MQLAAALPQASRPPSNDLGGPGQPAQFAAPVASPPASFETLADAWRALYADATMPAAGQVTAAARAHAAQHAQQGHGKCRLLAATALALAVLAAPLPAGAQTISPDNLKVTPDRHLQVLSPAGTVLYDVPLAGLVPLVDTPEGKAVMVVQADGHFGFVPYAPAVAAILAQVPPSPAPTSDTPPAL